MGVCSVLPVHEVDDVAELCVPTYFVFVLICNHPSHEQPHPVYRHLPKSGGDSVLHMSSSYKLDVNQSSLYPQNDETALHLVSRASNTAIITLLLDHKTDVNTVNKVGKDGVLWMAQ